MQAKISLLCKLRFKKFFRCCFIFRFFVFFKIVFQIIRNHIIPPQISNCRYHDIINPPDCQSRYTPAKVSRLLFFRTSAPRLQTSTMQHHEAVARGGIFGDSLLGIKAKMCTDYGTYLIAREQIPTFQCFRHNISTTEITIRKCHSALINIIQKDGRKIGANDAVNLVI